MGDKMSYGDMMYCKNCKKTFKDTWLIHDTRTDKLLTNCPFCRSKHTINATNLIDEFERMSRVQKGGKYGGLLDSYERFYTFLKRKQKIFNKKNLGEKK